MLVVGVVLFFCLCASNTSRLCTRYFPRGSKQDGFIQVQKKTRSIGTKQINPSTNGTNGGCYLPSLFFACRRKHTLSLP